MNSSVAIATGFSAIVYVRMYIKLKKGQKRNFAVGNRI